MILVIWAAMTMIAFWYADTCLNATNKDENWKDNAWTLAFFICLFLAPIAVIVFPILSYTITKKK